MKNSIKSIAVLFAILILNACATPDDEKINQDIEQTITGIATAIDFGKDGYTASINADDGMVYQALVSIVNVGGPDNYNDMNVGDKATLQGKVWMSGEQKNMTVSKIITIEKNDASLLITGRSFEGISPGDAIADYADVLSEEKLKTGEGTFDTYVITDKANGNLGYILPDPNDKKLVGNIVVTNPMAKTKDGFHVGSTWGDLLAKHPRIQVHGSEIEGRTYAKFGKLSFRLQSSNFTYEVNKETIPKHTKVIEILINR